MPRGKAQRNRVVGDGMKWNGFAVCEFNEDHRKRFAVWQEEQPRDENWSWFLENVDAFKITFSYSDAQSCYMVSMTGTDKDQQMYYGWTLTARGRDVDRTLAALRYKHEVMLQQKWVYQQQGDGRDDNWVG